MKALDLCCCDGGATKGLQEAGFHVTGVDILKRPKYCGDVFFQGDALDFPLEGYDLIWASPPCQAFSRLRHLHPKERPNLISAIRQRLVKSGIPYIIENVEGAPLGDSGFLIMLCGTMFGLATRDGRAELRRHRLFETSFSIPLRPSCQHGYVPSLSVCDKGGHFTAPKVLTVTGHTPVDNTKRETINVAGEGSPQGSNYNRHRKTLTVCGTGLDDNAMRNTRRRSISVTGSTPQTNTIRNVVREVFTVEQAREAMGIDWMSMRGLSQAIPPAYSRFIAEAFLRQRNVLQFEPAVVNG